MRDRSLDIVKGWSILAIMLLHYEAGIFPGVVNTWIGSFMVSAFYMTAAWVLAMKPLPTIGEAVRKLWKGLGIPYLTFSVLICCFTALMCLCGWMEWKILARDIWKFATLRGIGTLWFLPALFFGELIFLFFMQGRVLGKIVIFTLTLAFFCFYYPWYDTYRELSTLYKLIDSPLNAIARIGGAWIAITVFYAFARCFQKEINTMSHTSQLASGGIVLFLFTADVCGKLKGGYGILVGYLGPIGWLFIVKGVQKLLSLRFLEYCGRNSLIIMGLHFSIIQQICILINRQYTGQEGLSGWSSLFYFVGSVIVLIPCIKLVRRYPILLTGHCHYDH